MRLPIKVALISWFLGLNAIAGCGNNVNVSQTSSTNNPNSETQTSTITVSIPPQEYFVEKIIGKDVDVNVIVEAGTDPHTYEPKPEKLVAFSKSQAYITTGASFEQAWLERLKSANQNILIIDSGEGVPRIASVEHEHEHIEQETDAHHDEDGTDPHIWLAPNLVKIQAQNIYNGLIKIEPEKQSEYKANLDKFLAEIDQLNQQIQQNLSGLKQRKFIVFHPAWGYFAQEYKLTQIPIEVEGQEPSAAELAGLITEAKAQNIRVIFAQPEFSTKSADTIAKEINGKVLKVSDLAINWSDNLLTLSQELATANQ